MRERITFVQKLGDSLAPSAVTVDGGTIRGPEVHAAREDRLTIAFDELPPELRTLLRGTQGLHIRWISTVAYEAESFTSLPEGRLQYYQQLDSLSHFIQYAKDQLCRGSGSSCAARLDSLSRAASLDISYDASQQVLRITALWPYQRQLVHATSDARLRTEVGILSTDQPQTLEPHEVGISGLLTVLGQDSKPSPTMFAFASRHRDAESSFSAQFLSPTGLHPTLQLRLDSRKPPSSSPSPDVQDADDADSRCAPYAYLTLPRTIFADKYQLSDPLFLASKNLTALRYTTQPVDLEAPEYVTPQWGSAVLVQLSPPSELQPRGKQEQEQKQEQHPERWTAEIPLHLRYLAPAPGGYSTIRVPYPAVFWACEADEGAEFPPSPFEKAHLGYDALFSPRTVFWHVEPRPAEGQLLVSSLTVPVLDTDKAGWVNAGTAAAVLAGFVWVAWKLVEVYLRDGYGAGRKVEGDKKRQ
ncbi:cf84747d-741a-42ae-bc1e-aa6b35c16ff7 [Thermothielavioides terrestris]|uniref:Protein PBN1 n=1 Tax=Thermothielavioides terrestris TaxID=2587410 RepID=A0A446BJR7_9PEZI|nr:cf84747d-741a-42ae-bc1e-aa6b35c16ff7 [Thermothielavioides terrestris]